jgi:hypothetical protein
MAALCASLPGLEAIISAKDLCQQERNMMDEFPEWLSALYVISRVLRSTQACTF